MKKEEVCVFMMQNESISMNTFNKKIGERAKVMVKFKVKFLLYTYRNLMVTSATLLKRFSTFSSLRKL